MSKMTHKRKCEIVEALKVNERAYCFLSDDEKAVIKSVHHSKVTYLTHRDGFTGVGSLKGEERHGFIYRIKESYIVGIEPPEGYRLVTDEERGKWKKPEVFACLDIRLIATTDKWLFEVCNGYDTWYETHAYAVPVTFSFEPESMTLAEVCKELGRDIKITK